MNSKSGFSLTELLLYVGILAIVSGLFVGILLVVTRVNVTETASNEVANQMNFSLQTIQRLIRESSAVIVNNDCNQNEDLPIGSAYDCLVLRMKDESKDPTVIKKEISGTNEAITVKEGANPKNDLTTNKVTVPANGLKFIKFSNPPGHDIVQIDLTLDYKTNNPQSQFSKKLSTAVGRASAATFDSALLPGSNDLFDVGQNGKGWKGGHFTGDVTVLGNLKAGDANHYLQVMTQGTDAPTSGCSSASDAGRIYLRTGAQNRLYICTGTGVWKSAALQ